MLDSESNYPLELLPRTKPILRYFATFVCLAGLLLGIKLGSNVPSLLALVCLGVMCFVMRLDKCPQCRGQLISRVKEELPGRRRIYSDCPACRITWVTQHIMLDG